MRSGGGRGEAVDAKLTGVHGEDGVAVGFPAAMHTGVVASRSVGFQEEGPNSKP